MRSSGGVRRHPGNAAEAASTARPTSTAPASGTSARTSLVAGLITGANSSDALSTHSRLMYCGTLVTVGMSLSLWLVQAIVFLQNHLQTRMRNCVRCVPVAACHGVGGNQRVHDSFFRCLRRGFEKWAD